MIGRQLKKPLINQKYLTDQREYLRLCQMEWDEVHDIIKEIRKHNGQTVDVRKILFSTFTNNLMTLMFGERLPQGHPTPVYLTESIDYMIERFKAVSFSNFMPKLGFLLLKIGLNVSENIIEKVYNFGNFLQKYVDEELTKQSNNDEVFVQMYRKEAKLNPEISSNALYGDIQVIIFAGSETSRTAMVWILLALAEHQQIQKKIQEELDTVLGKDEKVNWSERDKTPYTYAAILEALRWKSFVPINPLRIVNTDVKIQGYDVPKGSIVIVNQWAVHNDSKYWTEPQKFDPQRFITKEGNLNNSPESYMPFSIGKRNCPGKNIALMEIFEYFTSIMKNFTVLPPENGIQYDTILGLTYQAMNMRLRLIPRD